MRNQKRLTPKDAWSLSVIIGQGPPRKLTRKKPFPIAIAHAKLEKYDRLYHMLTISNTAFFSLCYPSYQGESKRGKRRKDAILHIMRHWPVRQEALKRICSLQVYYRQQLALSLSTKAR